VDVAVRAAERVREGEGPPDRTAIVEEVDAYASVAMVQGRVQVLGEPGRTSYDLNFSVFGIPVRVHPLFWLIAVLLGGRNPDLKFVAVFALCVFVSILVHELGHALAARSYGWPPSIVLHGFGGVTRYSPASGYTRRRAIWITFAGPLAGFILFAVVLGLEMMIASGATQQQEWARNLTTSSAWPLTGYALYSLRMLNLFWGLFNLLPVVPLDGGQICAELLNARSSHQGRVRAAWIGMVTATVVGIWFLSRGMIIATLLFGGLAYENYQHYSQYRRRW